MLVLLERTFLLYIKTFQKASIFKNASRDKYYIRTKDTYINAGWQKNILQ